MIATLWLALIAGATAGEPDFGADVSLGYGAGMLIGSWPEPGIHGFLLARYDAFATNRDAPGPRLGASLWGTVTVAPLQKAGEPGADGQPVYHDFAIHHYGIAAALRSAPDARIGYSSGFGFGRLELSDYYGGPQVLPAATFEAGLRQRLPGDAVPSYLDWTVQAHWATSRSPTMPEVLHEWWMVQLAVSAGLHLR